MRKMSADGLEMKDIENAILSGAISQRLTHDPRGIRYEVVGDATDGRRACVVCRFLESGTLLIITAYAQEN